MEDNTLVHEAIVKEANVQRFIGWLLSTTGSVIFMHSEDGKFIARAEGDQPDFLISDLIFIGFSKAADES